MRQHNKFLSLFFLPILASPFIVLTSCNSSASEFVIKLTNNEEMIDFIDIHHDSYNGALLIDGNNLTDQVVNYFFKTDHISCKNLLYSSWVVMRARIGEKIGAEKEKNLKISYSPNMCNIELLSDYATSIDETIMCGSSFGYSFSSNKTRYINSFKNQPPDTFEDSFGLNLSLIKINDVTIYATDNSFFILHLSSAGESSSFNLFLKKSWYPNITFVNVRTI